MTDSRFSRRRFLQATGSTATALALAGCTGGGGEQEGSGDGGDGSAETGQQDKTYRIVSSTMSTFDPIKATDTQSGRVIQNAFEALTNYVDGSTQVEMLLASDFSVADDVSYTFDLMEGATYSDGREVTAGDFVYAFERLAASEHSRRKSFILDDLGVKHETETVTRTNEEGEEVEAEEYVPGTLAVEATDDYTLEVTLSEPFHASLEMLAYTSFSAIPEGIVGDLEGYDGEMSHAEFATENPVGSGPFTLENWEEGTEITMSARPVEEYHGPGPTISGWHGQVIEKTNPTYTYATVNMNADHPSVPPSKYDASKVTIEGTDDRGRKFGTYGPLENDLTVPYYRVAEVSTYYFGFNADAVDRSARKAFAYAYNQQEVNQQVFKGREKPAYFFTPPGIFPGGATNYAETAEAEYPYGFNETDLEAATRLMEDAGYSESNQYTFTMTTYESNSFKQASQLMQDKLGAAHIDMKYEQTPFSTLLTRGRNGDLDAYSLGWIADYPAPDNFLKLLYPPFTQTSRSDNLSNFNWDGTPAAEQAERGWQMVQDNPLPNEAGTQARNEGYLMIERANWKDAIMVPVIHSVEEYMDYPWLEKPRFGAMGDTRQKFNQVKIGDRSEYTDQ